MEKRAVLECLHIGSRYKEFWKYTFQSIPSHDFAPYTSSAMTMLIKTPEMRLRRDNTKEAVGTNTLLN